MVTRLHEHIIGGGNFYEVGEGEQLATDTSATHACLAKGPKAIVATHYKKETTATICMALTYSNVFLNYNYAYNLLIHLNGD